MKQLNSKLKQQIALASQFEQMMRSKRMQVNQRRGASQRGNVRNTAMPLTTGQVVTQSANNKVTVVTHRELIGTFTVFPNVNQAPTVFQMDPTKHTNTRLQRMALNFQKYRFTKLSLTVQSTLPTTVAGAYTVGYQSNPDHEIARVDADKQITNMPGAKTASLYQSVTAQAVLEDRNKWYIIDQDADEVMQTVQGYFALMAIGKPTITGPSDLLVWLDYSVQFLGAAIQYRNDGAVVQIPAGTWVYTAGSGGAPDYWAYTISSDETLPYTALGTSTNYAISPSLMIGDEGAGSDMVASAILNVGSGYVFAKSIDDLITKSYIVPLGGVGNTFYSNRIYATPIFY